MNIHYLSLSEVISQTANSVHVMKMSAALAACGHSVTLHAKHGQHTADAHAYYGTPKNFTLTLHKSPNIRKLGALTYALCTAISCWQHRGNSLAYGRDPFSLLAAATMGIQVALELHTLPEKPMWIWAIRTLLRSRRLRGLVTITRSLRDDVASMFSLDTEDILVAPDAADDPHDGTLPPPPASSRPLQVGYVGSLYKGKGAERVLALAERCPNMQFTIVGGQDHEIEALRSKQAPRNVRYAGFVPHSQLGAHYTKFDVMLAPYGKNVAIAGNGKDVGKYMSPLKLFEYMSYGKPIVATKLAVLDEIQELETFCLSPPLDDIDQWADCLRALDSNKELRVQMGKQAYAVFSRHYTWSTRASNILKWLEQRPQVTSRHRTTIL